MEKRMACGIGVCLGCTFESKQDGKRYKVCTDGPGLFGKGGFLMISERIAVEFAGISMKTPVMGASGTFGFGIEYADFLDLDAVGAIISKGITPLPRPGNPGVRVAETPAGMLNCIGLENPGVDALKGISCPR